METNTGGNSNAIYWQLNPISRTASVPVPRIIHRDGFILGREDTEKEGIEESLDSLSTMNLTQSISTGWTIIHSKLKEPIFLEKFLSL